MKNPKLQGWLLVSLLGGVALAGVGLQVIGETTSATGRPETNAGARLVLASGPDATVPATEAGDGELFGASTNHFVPANLNVSPDLAEFIKLAQAGLGEDVMMAYIGNAVRVFNLGSDEIIYLNDLGVPPSVLTAMIQQDTSPASAAQKLASNPPNPLPAGLALNSPASNVYPSQQPAATEPEENAAETDYRLLPVASVVATDYAPQPAAVSSFYDALAPYGNWIEVSGYGLCWQPTVVTVNRSWQPYCDRGRWIYSDSGWYWLSDYSWGWAPFHYGRWVSHANYGWVWAPDCTWGPAWVSWRYSQSYCGWAPLPPEACFSVSLGFTFHHRAVGSDCEFGLRAHHYNFIPFERFCEYAPSRYRVSPQYAQNIYNQTKFMNRIRIKGNNNNVVINEGFDPTHVAATTRTEVRMVSIRDTSSPSGRGIKYDHLERDGNQLVVMRPQLPSPVPARTGNSGGSLRSGNRDKAAMPSRTTSGNLALTGRTDSTGVSGSPSPRPPRENSSDRRFAFQENHTTPAPAPERERPRVYTSRTSTSLTIRGEPRQTQTSTTAETTSPVPARSEPIRVSRPKESPRALEAKNIFQPQATSRQTQTFTPAQPAPRSAPEPIRVERQQPRSLRNEVSAPQAAPSRTQFSAPAQTPARPAYTPPTRPQFNPPPAPSQPARVEHRNEVRSQPQIARPEPAPRPSQPAHTPQPSQRSFSPARESAPQGNGGQSSQNSSRGERKR